MRWLLLLGWACLFVAAAPARAAPPPAVFYGALAVDLDGRDPSTLQITAWIDGVKFGTAAAQWEDNRLVYVIAVRADDPETPAKDGGVSGDTVKFKIGARWAKQHGYWQNGRNIRLDLSPLPGREIFLPVVLR